MKNQNTQGSLVQDTINTQKESNEKDRRVENEVTPEPKDKNDSVQLSSRFLQYTYAKRHLRGTPRPEVFPIGNFNPKTLRELTTQKSQGYRVYDTDGISTTLASQAGGIGAKTGLYANTIDANYYKGINTNPGHASSTRGIVVPVLTPDRAKKRQNGRRFKEDGEPSFTLTGQDKHGVYDGMAIRRLTPTECMRLQGFPDDWCDLGADGEIISDSQKYKMAGNAVTTNVVTEVIKTILKKEEI